LLEDVATIYDVPGILLTRARPVTAVSMLALARAALAPLAET
jgi:hypothetical protein